MLFFWKMAELHAKSPWEPSIPLGKYNKSGKYAANKYTLSNKNDQVMRKTNLFTHSVSGASGKCYI